MGRRVAATIGESDVAGTARSLAPSTELSQSSLLGGRQRRGIHEHQAQTITY